MEEAGIFVSSCGFLGASPDGVVSSGERTIKLIEVKCPYRARHVRFIATLLFAAHLIATSNLD